MGLKTKANFIFSCSVGALLAAAAPNVALAQAPAAPAATPAPKAAAKAKTAPAAAPQGEDAQAAAAAKKKDPAEAQRAIDAGIKQLQSGKAEQAIQTFTTAIASGNMPPPLMARALYQRGVAYRKAQKPAQAISDLTSALWLKNGLQDADRQDAVKQRSDAYREAGLPDQTGEDGRPAGARTARATTVPGDTVAPSPSVTTASLAPQQAAPAPASGGLFASLFGSGGSKTPAAVAEPAAPRVTAPAAPQASTSAWSSAAVAAPAAPKVAPAAPSAPPVKTASAAPAAAAAAAAPAKAMAAPAAGIHARIALVRTDAEAEGVVAKLKVSHAAALGNKTPVLSQAQFGGMGSFVQVRVGPFASTIEAQAFCGKLKGSGLDCVPVDR